MIALNLLVKASYLKNEDTESQTGAQFKLFGLVGQLHKFTLKSTSLKKGHCKD
jgi:hypothetical protein